MNDYYKILGVERTASQDEIKKSFRKLAQKYHPDKATGDEAKFKEINEAYETLSDPEKRKVYDVGGNQSHGFHQQGGFSGFEDMFNNIFGNHHNPFNNNPFNNNPFQNQNSSRKSVGFATLDFEMNLELDLSEAYKGVKKTLNYKSRVYCSPCSGFGGTLSNCKTCNGTGVHSQKQGFMIFNTPCGACHGIGKTKDVSNSCKSCSGLGYTLENQSLDLDIPAGSGQIDASMRLSVHGKGSRFNNQRGSLVLNIALKKQTKFKQDGLNLLTKERVAFSDLVLGKTLEVELPDKTKTSIKLQPKTNLGENYIIKRMGMPQPGSAFRGDLVVGLELILPEKLTSEQESLLHQLRQSGL